MSVFVGIKWLDLQMIKKEKNLQKNLTIGGVF